MLSLTKGRLKPVLHHVASPGEDYKGSGRTSITLFLLPHRMTPMSYVEGSTLGHLYDEKGAISYQDFMSEFVKHLTGQTNK